MMPKRRIRRELRNRGNPEVPDLDPRPRPRGHHEQIVRLDIPMGNQLRMQQRQPIEQLKHDGDPARQGHSPK